MDLEEKVLMFLQGSPDKGYTVFEILSAIYEIKIAPTARTRYFREIWEIKGALNSLENKGLIDRAEDQEETHFKIKK